MSKAKEKRKIWVSKKVKAKRGRPFYTSGQPHTTQQRFPLFVISVMIGYNGLFHLHKTNRLFLVTIMTKFFGWLKGPRDPFAVKMNLLSKLRTFPLSSSLSLMNLPQTIGHHLTELDQQEKDAATMIKTQDQW